MKRYLADLIIPGKGRSVANGMLLTNDDGTILDLIHPGQKGYKTTDAMYFEGALVPGFVNAHLHLELSHLKGRIPQRTGLDGFVEHLGKVRHEIPLPDEFLLAKTDEEMHEKGVVAAGDICNTHHTFDVKIKSKIRYHNFIELFAIRPERATQVFQQGLELQRLAQSKGLSASLSPHAPYSASDELMRLITSELKTNSNKTLSIHFQESEEEIEFISTGGGKMSDRLRRMNINTQDYKAEPDGPTAWLIRNIPATQRLLTVHNTFSSAAEIGKLAARFDDVWFCTCPSANLYITGKIPDKNTLLSAENRWCVGTDSLASNTTLDMLHEMRIIQETYGFNLEKLIPMATLQGARALGLDQEFGSFEAGKRPGIVHLSKLNHKELLILPETRSRLI